MCSWQVRGHILETIASDPGLQQTELVLLGLFGRAARILNEAGAAGQRLCLATSWSAAAVGCGAWPGLAWPGRARHARKHARADQLAWPQQACDGGWARAGRACRRER